MDETSQGMRDHPFGGDGRWCTAWKVISSRMTAEGLLQMREQCGYPRDKHPQEGN